MSFNIFKRAKKPDVIEELRAKGATIGENVDIIKCIMDVTHTHLITVGNNKVFGDKIYNWGMTYYDMLNEVLKRKEKLFMFRTVMNHYYGAFLHKDGFRTDDQQNCAPFFFHVTDIEGKISPDIRKKLKECEIEFDDNKVIRFRSPNFLQRPDLLIKGVNILNSVLEEMEE